MSMLESAYSVTCPDCDGKRFDRSGILCITCNGDGSLLVVPRRASKLTTSETAVREMMRIMFWAALCLGLAICALRWLRVL